jgi:hypothetical protein
MNPLQKAGTIGQIEQANVRAGEEVNVQTVKYSGRAAEGVRGNSGERSS